MKWLALSVACFAFSCSTADSETCVATAVRIDRTNGCVGPGEQISYACERSRICPTITTCLTRESDGQSFWFPDGCPVPGFRACSGAERTVGINGPRCGEDGGGTCPGVASSCPSSCEPLNARKIDPTKKCLQPSEVVGCATLATGCTAALTCLVRMSDGAAFWFTGDCHTNGWRACTSAEQATSWDGPACGADAGGD